MTIRARLDDARILWAAERKEGAFLLILCAADATAKKRYPKLSVGDRFRKYVRDEMGTITGGPEYGVEVPFLGKPVPLEEVLYTHLRCNLVHEGTVPGTIEFTEPIDRDGKKYNLLSLKSPLGIPINFAWNLFKTVWDSPENVEACGQNAPSDSTDTVHLIAAIDVLSELGLRQRVTATVL